MKKIFKIFLISSGIIILSLCIWVAISGYKAARVTTQTANTHTNSYSCARKTPFQNPPEFSRALSLVLQRHEQYLRKITNTSATLELPYLYGDELTKSGVKDVSSYLYWETLKQYQNCIQMNYMSSKEEDDDLQAYFTFSKTSTPQELKILVSNKFKTQDDLLVAILLSHELHHVASYILGYPPIKIEQDLAERKCFVNETAAFIRQLAFLNMLNNEEVSSLKHRLNDLSSSGIKDLSSFLIITEGKKREEIQKMIEEDQYYQAQCKAI